MLATASGLDMTTTWTATAASYFSRVATARMLEAVTEAVGKPEADRIAGFKKTDMAESCELRSLVQDGCRRCCGRQRRRHRMIRS